MLMLSASALAETTIPDTLTFAINRNGEQIGTNTIQVQKKGSETLVTITTRIEVKIVFITAYSYGHDEHERWVSGHLVSLTSVTDDNGTPHKVEVAAKGNVLQVIGDGKTSQVDANIIPSSLWNAALVKQTVALNTRDGSVMKIAVTDVGMESITVHGQPAQAHRYSVQGPFPQELWYDQQGHLVQAQFVGSDGSIILYQLI